MHNQNQNYKINSAEILCVGTELLLGEVINTNAAYISTRFAQNGIPVYHHTVVGDNVDRLKSALKIALTRCDIVVITGGLGPTYDDMTKETVAQMLGLPLVRHSDELQKLKAYFERVNRPMADSNLKQVDIPLGATVLENDFGTAPGVFIINENFDSQSTKMIAMLPGPPREMKPMLDNKLLPILLSYSDTKICSRNLHIFGLGESSLETLLHEEMINAKNPSIAPYAQDGEVRLRVTAKAKDEETAYKMCDELIDTVILPKTKDYVYGIDVGSLENALVKLLQKEKLTISTAESCTGGYVSKRITNVSGCSDVYLGSVVSYANEIKTSLLGVKEETLNSYGAVSKETAIEMALGAKKALGTDIAISTTGIAGPGGGSVEKPVGLVYIGVAYKEQTWVKEVRINPKMDREYIRYLASSNAIALAIDVICGKI